MDKEKWDRIVAWAHGHDPEDDGVPYDVFFDLYNAYCDDQQRARLGVAVLVERPDGTVLMGLRKGDHGGGKYSFPGGHVEYKEEPLDTARREVLEETGIELERQRIRPNGYVSTVFENGKHYITLLFRVAVPQNTTARVLEPHKCEFWEWVSKESPPEPLFEPVLELTKRPRL